MNQLKPYQGSELLPGDSRRAGRSVSRYQSGSLVRTAKIDSDTDVALAKADALTAATGRAMAAVVRVAQAQRQLEQLAPEASGRLALLADGHALAMSDVVADLTRDMRRR